MDGRGVALGQVTMIAEDLATGRLVEPFGLRLATGFAYWLCYPPASAERPKIKAFCEWVMGEIGAAAKIAPQPAGAHPAKQPASGTGRTQGDQIRP